ncbi:hypothetical protein [Streptomyces rochei]|uniref:hypothetical protein n=1 Tax=Streptomyces rochei TaxID=1928 RepID=UPI0036BB0823
MSNPELSAAATKLRRWIADEPEGWTPSAVAVFGPDLVSRLEQAPPETGPELLAAARAINTYPYTSHP